MEIIPHTFYLGLKLHSPMINNNNNNNTNKQKQCTIDCLDDIVGGVGLTHTYSTLKTHNDKNNNANNNKSTNDKGIVVNYILLRCSSNELVETLKKSYLIGYFRKWHKYEDVEIPPPNS